MFNNNQELEHVFDHIDLRVILDADLCEHITTKIKKANLMVGLTQIGLSYLNGLLFKKFFMTVE